MKNRLYPIFLKLEERRCVVVGGGHVAWRKVEALLECGACVTVVAPEAEPELERLNETGELEWLRREYQPGDLEGARLAIASVDDPEVNRAVFEEASRRGIPCNVVDRPEQCDFYVPSVLRRGDLTVAVSTNGKSPSLAGGIRRMLEREIGEEFGEILERADKLRDKVRRLYPNDTHRRMETLKEWIRADELTVALRERDSETRDAILASWTSYLSD